MSGNSVFLSRRAFLQSAALLSAAQIASRSSFFYGQSSSEPIPSNTQEIRDWEFLKDSLAGPWEAYLTDQTNPWTKVSLPHCFNNLDGCDPDVPYYQGPGWYRTHLTVANPFPNGRTLLHFEAAGQEAKVYVGLDLVEEHIGGYDEFVVDITELAAKHVNDKGGVPIAVMCTNAHNLDRIPSQMSDFTLYGGLYRKVHVVYVPLAWLDTVQITAQESSEGYRVVMSANHHHSPVPGHPVNGDGASTVQWEIFDPRGERIYSSDEQLIAQFGDSKVSGFNLIKSPQLWSPASPSLYHCRVTLRRGNATQVIEERFGCRSFHFEEHGAFFLNGEKCFLRGTHRHEDHAGYGAATPPDVVRKEMQLIKDMGANFIRLGHYQQSKLVLDLCDELGLIVWEEVPWCRAGAGSDKMQQMVLDKLRIMIEQHYNHPSIVFWGLGNEDDWPGEFPSINKDGIRALMEKARDVAHKADPTRLTSYRRCDFARDIPDVYSPSIWAGWYGGRYTDYQTSLETQRTKQKYMLHIEWGADSHAGRHAEHVPIVEIPKDANTAETGFAFKMSGGGARMSKDGDWSETYACDLFDWHLKTQETLPWFAGSAFWTFKDFTTPLRPENPVPRINQKGVAARDLTLKESYYVFQSYWAKKPMLHIKGHTWPVRWGKTGEEKTVKVYSNCAEVELFLNGVSLGKKKRNSQDFPAAGLRWSASFKEGENTLRAVGVDGVTDEVRFKYQTAAWDKPTQYKWSVLQSESIGNGWTRSVAEVQLCDTNAIPCLDAAEVVHFSLAGDGHLEENQGTPWGSRTVQLANGRARVTAFHRGGTAQLAAASEGIPSASIPLGPVRKVSI